MNKLKRTIGLIIIFLILIIVICIIAISILNNNKENISNVDSENVYEEEEDAKTEKLRGATQFFSIEECIKKDVEESFTAKDMNVLRGIRIVSYAVYGEIVDSDTQETKPVYYIFRTDSDNNAYEIETLEDGKYDDINKIDLETDITEIKSNGNNTIQYNPIKDEQMSRKYLEQFSKLELEKPEEAYKLLDEEYKKERFSNYDEYKEYVTLNKEKIQLAVLLKYSTNYYDDYTEYVLVDNYDNHYTLKESSIMNYSIVLDNYTIKDSEYEEKYNNLDDEQKIQANVYIFLQMINTKDYRHAYELLDETFKQNNFDTLEKFKQYVNEKFFSYNINISDTSEKSIEQKGEYYSYKTILRNNNGRAAQTKNLTIIMKLEENTKFKMSFDI